MRLLLLLAVTTALVTAGCVQQAGTVAVNSVGCVDATGVDNAPGSFEYAGLLTCKDGTESYDWANPSPTAGVEWGGAVDSGSVTLRILDSAGRTVYEDTVTGTSAGGVQAGTDMGFPAFPPVAEWTIELTFEAFNGAMGLEVTSGA